MAWNRPNAFLWLLCAGLALPLAGGAAARAADSETREFAVLVDGKSAGTATMTIEKKDDGSTVVSCDTNVTVRVLIKKYVYTCQTREVWKDSRLQQFASRCNDDGKQYEVSAAAQADGVRVRVNGRERTAKPEVWLSSYWTLPDPKVRTGVVPVLDADNGRDLQVRIQHIGEAQIAVAGQVQNVQHYRLTGSVRVELYYDAAGRLVRQEWVEEGHPTTLELTRLRR
jgi:YD repeat-containing protein